MMTGANKTMTLLLAATLAGPANCAEAPPAPGDVSARVNALVAKVKKTLVHFPGGSFDMGDWGDENGQHYDIDTWSRPLHKVTLDGFSMMAYKVTYEDFDVFTDASGIERVATTGHFFEYRAPNRAAGVNWHGARAYCQWLGQLTKLPFDLPTEAQWEYAARSGGKRVLYGTDNGKIERPRNFPRLWRLGEPELPLPDVGSYPPNPAGLYGITEDAREWARDWFDENYYKVSPEHNPTGPAAGEKKAQRGNVGGKAEISAAVFMCTSALPQSRRIVLSKTPGEPLQKIVIPGFTSWESDNFRCIVERGTDIH